MIFEITRVFLNPVDGVKFHQPHQPLHWTMSIVLRLSRTAGGTTGIGMRRTNENSTKVRLKVRIVPKSGHFNAYFWIFSDERLDALQNNIEIPVIVIEIEDEL